MKLFSPSAIRAEKRLSAGLALIVVIAVVVAIVLLTRSPGSGNASAQNSNATGAATVERRDLVETDTESGTLSYAGTQTVYNRLSGTITWLPNVGQVIRPGQALFRIDNQPIILMKGSTPAYRDLSASDVQGPDVLELNRNLIALGFNPGGIIDDDVWQAATTDGVEQFQASLGETETGILTLGQVVFLPGAQLIGTVDGTVGSTGGGASSSTGTAYDLTGPHSEFVSLTTTTQTSTTPTSTTPTTTPPKHHDHSHKHGHTGHKGHRGNKGGKSLANLVAQLQAEIQHLESQHNSNPNSSSNNNSSHKNSPSHKSNSNDSDSTHPSSSSSGDTSATEILQTSSTHLVVTVDLAASSQSEAVRGERVTVEMPNNTTVNGVITQVSKVAQTSSSDNSGAGAGGGGSGGGNGSGGSSATIPVTIRLIGHITGAGLDQAPVSVNFAEAKAKNVLSVPVTALVATAGGHYAVQEAAAPHKLIPVQTGLFAAGYVAISGAGIYQGLQVTDSQG